MKALDRIVRVLKARRTPRMQLQLFLLALAVVLFVAVLLVRLYPPFTAFFAAGQLETYEQAIDLEASTSVSYPFILERHPESFYLVALKASGTVAGTGTARLFLETPDGRRFLVLDSSRLNEGSGTVVTGRSVEGADSGGDSDGGDGGGSGGDSGGDGGGSDGGGDSGSESSDGSSGDSGGSAGGESADGAGASGAPSAGDAGAGDSEESSSQGSESQEGGAAGDTAQPPAEQASDTSPEAPAEPSPPAEQPSAPSETTPGKQPALPAEPQPGEVPAQPSEPVPEEPLPEETPPEQPAEEIAPEQPTLPEEIPLPEEQENATAGEADGEAGEVVVPEETTEGNATGIVPPEAGGAAPPEQVEPPVEQLPVMVRFEHLCLETCLITDILNFTEYTLVFEVEGEIAIIINSLEYSIQVVPVEEAALPNATELPIENITNVTLPNETFLPNVTLLNETLLNLTNVTLVNATLLNVTNITEVATELIKDDPRYEVIVDSTTEEDGTLKVIFHHDSPNREPIFVDGNADLSYLLSQNESVGGENVTLTINNWDPEESYFEIKVGAQSEIVGFGKLPEFDVVADVEDAHGEKVDVTIDFEDPETQEDKHVSSGTTHQTKIKRGIYDIRVKPLDHPIKEIVIEDVDIKTNISEFIDIEDVNETGDFAAYAEVYAIDPTRFNFTQATVTVTAKGTELLKCKEWNFTSQTCFGTWVKVMDLTPGQEYTFTLTPEDPGFAEIPIQSCAAEDEAAKGSFGGVCDFTDGSALRFDGGTTETHTFAKNKYGGVKITSYNTSITDCTSITQVNLCYEWWISDGTPVDCDVSIDADGGGSFTASTITCPGTAANPGVTCADVTSLESWSCGNFFGSSGTRAQAKSELARVTGGAPSTHTATWDVLFFNVTYSTSDIQAPQYSNLIQNPSGPSTYTSGQAYIFNATWTDNVAVDTVNFEFAGTNRTPVVQNGNVYGYQLVDLAAGTYNYKWYANDTSNIRNDTGTLAYTINPAASAVNLSLNGNAANVSVSVNALILLNATRLAGEGAIELLMNGTAINSSGTNLLYNARFGSPGNRTVVARYLSTQNYSASSVNYNISVVDNAGPNPGTLTEPTDPSTYAADAEYIFNASWTDDMGISVAWIEFDNRNYTTTLVNANNYNITIRDLAAGTYNYRWYANDTSNNVNSTVVTTFTVSQAVSSALLYLNGNRSNVAAIYSTQTNASAYAQNGTVTLYRDGAAVNNPEIASLAVGTYNYTALNPGNQNYSSSSEIWFLTVTQSVDTVNLFLDGNQSNITITYGTQSNATATSTSGTHQLFRDGVLVSNPEIATLGVGTYIYKANSTGNTNTTASAGTSYALTVNPTASEVNLLLNGADGDITVEVDSVVNITGLRVTGEGIIQTYRNGTLLNSGASPLTNLTSFTSLGTFNITVLHPATQNYTTSSETHIITVQDTTLPVVSLFSPVNGTQSATRTHNFVFNFTDNLYSTASCTLSINAIASGTNGSVNVNTLTTITNSSVPEGANSWYVACTDGSSNTGQSATRTLTVDISSPNITLIRPTQGVIVGYSVTLDADVSDNVVGVGNVSYEIRNASQVVSSGVLNAPLYQTIWASSSVADGNYTFTVYANDTLGNQDNRSANFTVDNTQPFIQILRPVNATQWNANFNLNITFQNTMLNVTRYNITNSSGFIIQTNTTDPVNSNYAQFADLVTITNRPDGQYTITAYAKDSIGYERVLQSTFIIDKTAPSYSAITEPADPATYSSAATYTFNATWTDTNGISAAVLEFDGVNYTDVNQNGNVYGRTFSALPAGTHSYKWYANDTIKNRNDTGLLTYTVNKAASAVNLTLNGIAGNLSLEAGTAALLNATRLAGEGTIELLVNGSVVNSSGTSLLYATSYPTLGNRTVVARYFETQNFTASSVNFNISVIDTTGPNPGTLTEPADPSAYTPNAEYIFNASWTDVVGVSAVWLEFDHRNYTATLVNTNNYNATIRDLAGGVYNYRWYASDTSNNVNSTVAQTFTVNPTADSVALYLNGNQSNVSITYGTQSNTTATSTSGTQQLFREGVLVSNPEVATLAAGPHQYKANTTGNQNYSANAGATYNLSVTKAASSVNLLLNGVDGNISVNRSQNVNISAYRTAGEGNIQMYDSGVLISSGAAPLTNITSYATLSQRNITLINPETQNYTSSSETHFVTIMGNISATVDQIAQPAPVFYQGQSVTFNGSAVDDLGTAVTGATVIFEAINDSTAYRCGTTVELGGGKYSCALNTAGMIVPTYYMVRMNATKDLHHQGTTTRSTAFYLSYDQSANLTLQKVANLHNVSSSQITYNVTLYLSTTRGSSENTTLSDPTAGQVWSKGTISAQTVSESYLLSYNRGATDNQATLGKANATGYDPLYTTNLFTESNQPVVVVPENESAVQLTLIKNIFYRDQNTTQIDYNVTIQVVDSGDTNLTDIEVTDTNLGVDTKINLTEGGSWTYSAIQTLAKNPQATQYALARTRASASGTIFYSNNISLVVPGYGGPYDVVITSLPSTATTGETITASIEAINQNTEVSEDRVLTTVLRDAAGTVYDLDARTIFVGRNQSAATSVTLTVPNAEGTYYVFSELVWPTATANATQSFQAVRPAVKEEGPETAAPGAGGGGGGGVVACGDKTCDRTELKGGANECINDCGYDCTDDGTSESWVACVVEVEGPSIPSDVKEDLITLHNTYNQLSQELQRLSESGADTADAQETLDTLQSYIRDAEEQAAKGNFDWARNVIRSAYRAVSFVVVVGRPGESALSGGAVQEIQSAGLKFFRSKPFKTALLAIVIVGLLALLVVKKIEHDEQRALHYLQMRRRRLELLNQHVDIELEQKMRLRKKDARNFTKAHSGRLR